MKKNYILLLAILLPLGTLTIQGQKLTKDTSPGYLSDSKYGGIYVYLHTDRSYYMPGESILFKAYFLDNLNDRSYPLNDTLHMSLLDQNGIEVASGLFPVINNMINGVLELPDYLTSGSYILIAGTPMTGMQSPEKIFSSVIEVIESVEPDLITELSLTDTLYKPESTLISHLRFYGPAQKPVPLNFSYVLTGSTGEIVNGKGKSGSDGMAEISLQLPAFDEKEVLKLLVTPSYKGNKTVTGIVIPTRYNSLSEIASAGAVSSAGSLNILLKAATLSSGQKGKVHLDISVTGKNGAPVMADLLVSATNIIPQQPADTNSSIVSFINLKFNANGHSSRQANPIMTTNTNADDSGIVTGNSKSGSVSDFKPEILKYFAACLVNQTQLPGKKYIVQENNDAKKLNKRKESLNRKNQGYRSDQNIMDILMQIKPYRIDNGRITFGIGTQNSINNPNGALIVVDGIKMGTDPSILSTIPVEDIAHIAVLTNVMDIQRYSGLNAVGVIEITMKKSSEYLKNEESGQMTKSSTLLWGPDIMTDKSGNASAEFYTNRNSGKVRITVEGISANGLCGFNSVIYPAEK